VPVNCGAIPGELMESEFFGHRAASAAPMPTSPACSRLAWRHPVPDEVAELPLQMQVKLLRAIQENRCARSAPPTEAGGRASSRPPTRTWPSWSRRRFRHDLYYRINVIELKVPLRERRRPAGTGRSGTGAPGPQPWPRHAAAGAVGAGRAGPYASRATCANWRTSSNARWPGRRRPHRCRRPASQHAPRARQRRAAEAVADLQPGSAACPRTSSSSSAAPSSALEENRWNKTRTAAQLGITFRALRYKLKKLGME
jgi:two-component system response regulator PilR (NtrC family)